MGSTPSSVPHQVFPGKETGAALITALLLLTLAATAAMGLNQLQKREIRRTANLIHYDQALALAKSGEQWASGILRRQEELTKINTKGKVGRVELPTVTSTDCTAKGYLEDLQSRLNVNNLVSHGAVDAIAVQRFQRLLTLLGVSTDLLEPVLIRLGANPGMDHTQILLKKEWQPQREDSKKMVAPSPFFTTNDLLTLPGWQHNPWQIIEPFLTCLPGMAIPINVNTASREMLMALGDSITAMTAATLITAREMTPFASTSDFISHPAMAGKGISEVELTVVSNFFLVTMESRIGHERFFLRSLLARSNDRVEVLARQEGLVMNMSH